MWISKVILKSMRGFENVTIELSKSINLLVGPNNSGKSTIANAALLTQGHSSFNQQDIRIGESLGEIEIYFNGDDKKKYFVQDFQRVVFGYNQNGGQSVAAYLQGGQNANYNYFPATEPKNFIYPYLSKRKVTGYSEQINEQLANTVSGNLGNLYAKVDRLSNPRLPAHQVYMDACQNILEFSVTSTTSTSGKKGCYVIDNFRNITIDKMGEGVASILGLLVDLCVANNKLFVIEEPENDIHPKSLKALLGLISLKSKNNQFIITTHSNIVTRYLGSETDAKIFSVSVDYTHNDKIPTSKVVEIDKTPEARRDLLEELGYEFNDLELWEGWLFLEEASAEKIVREYLIRWFTPSLQGKLRTFSARTVDMVNLKFDDFNRLFCYLYLQPSYKNRAWVIVDGGENEKIIIEELKAKYTPNGWEESHFQQFGEHDFEKYYPDNFKDNVIAVLDMANGKERQEKKKELLESVEAWIKQNDNEAKISFETSAADVIIKLQAIEKQITGNKK